MSDYFNAKLVRLVRDSDITDASGKQNPRAKAVLSALASHARDDGSEAWPGQDLLSAETGLCVHAVQHALVWLQRWGYVVADGAGGGARRGAGRPVVKYRLCLDMLTARHASPPPVRELRPSRGHNELCPRDGLYPPNKVNTSQNKVHISSELRPPDGHEVFRNFNKEIPEEESAEPEAEADGDTRRAWCAPQSPLAGTEADTTAIPEADSGSGADVWCVVADAQTDEATADIATVRRAHRKDSEIVAALAHQTWQARADALDELYERRWWTVPTPEQRDALLVASEPDYRENDISEERDRTWMAARYRLCRLPYIHFRRRRWRQSTQSQQQQQQQLDEADESEYLTA